MGLECYRENGVSPNFSAAPGRARPWNRRLIDALSGHHHDYCRHSYSTSFRPAAQYRSGLGASVETSRPGRKRYCFSHVPFRGALRYHVACGVDHSRMGSDLQRVILAWDASCRSLHIADHPGRCHPGLAKKACRGFGRRRRGKGISSCVRLLFLGSSDTLPDGSDPGSVRVMRSGSEGSAMRGSTFPGLSPFF